MESKILGVDKDEIERKEGIIDVRGQTCPGYLLNIDKIVRKLAVGTIVKLLISYPPCAKDIEVWCNRKGHEIIDIKNDGSIWMAKILI